MPMWGMWYKYVVMRRDSKMTFIGKGVIKNVAGGILHLIMIIKFYVSLTIT